MANQDVVFRRIRGRVVPIRRKKGSASHRSSKARRSNRPSLAGIGLSTAKGAVDGALIAGALTYGFNKRVAPKPGFSIKKMSFKGSIKGALFGLASGGAWYLMRKKTNVGSK